MLHIELHDIIKVKATYPWENNALYVLASFKPDNSGS